jgi:hypothetical protein
MRWWGRDGYMVWEVETDGVTAMYIHSLGETTGKGFDALLELVECDFLAGWAIDEGNAVGVTVWRHVSDRLSPEHERVDVCVWDKRVLPWCSYDMLRVNGDAGHCRLWGRKCVVVVRGMW